MVNALFDLVEQNNIEEIKDFNVSSCFFKSFRRRKVEYEKEAMHIGEANKKVNLILYSKFLKNDEIHTYLLKKKQNYKNSFKGYKNFNLSPEKVNHKRSRSSDKRRM